MYEIAFLCSENFEYFSQTRDFDSSHDSQEEAPRPKKSLVESFSFGDGLEQAL